MSATAQKIRLGIFVIIGTILFVIAVYAIGQQQNMFGKSFTINAGFENVKGLQKGNNVRFAGIHIGTVSNISMINDTLVLVEMLIDQEMSQHIKKNAVASIGSDGLVGNIVVNIAPGEGASKGIESGDTIQAYEGASTSEMLNTLSSTNDYASELMQNLIQVTNSLNEGEGTLGLMLNDRSLASDLKQSINNLKLVSEKALSSIEEVNEVIKELKPSDESIAATILKDDESGQNLQDIIANLDSSSVEIKELSSKLNDLVTNIQESDGTLNLLLNDTTLVNDLRSSVESVKAGTDKFDQNMEALKHNFLFKKYFKKK